MAFGKILIAYDGSSGSKKAMAWAMEVARKFDSQTILVAVVNDPFGWFKESEPETMVMATKLQREELSNILKEAENQFIQNALPVTTVLLNGSPGDELIDYAKNNHVDLIVTGTRGYGTSSSLMLGSVAHKLATYSPIPITIVK